MAASELRVKDNDRDEITVSLGDKEMRGWSYSHAQEQYWKMQMAREFVEGYYTSHAALLAALMDYDNAFTSFDPDDKASRHTMRLAVIKARDAISQATSSTKQPKAAALP